MSTKTTILTEAYREKNAGNVKFEGFFNDLWRIFMHFYAFIIGTDPFGGRTWKPPHKYVRESLPYILRFHTTSMLYNSGAQPSFQMIVFNAWIIICRAHYPVWLVHTFSSYMHC